MLLRRALIFSVLVIKTCNNVSSHVNRRMPRLVAIILIIIIIVIIFQRRVSLLISPDLNKVSDHNTAALKVSAFSIE